MVKKKYRRAVYRVLVIVIIALPYRLFYYPATWMWKFTNCLKTKLRVYDTDPDRPATAGVQVLC